MCVLGGPFPGTSASLNARFASAVTAHPWGTKLGIVSFVWESDFNWGAVVGWSGKGAERNKRQHFRRTRNPGGCNKQVMPKGRSHRREGRESQHQRGTEHALVPLPRSEDEAVGGVRLDQKRRHGLRLLEGRGDVDVLPREGLELLVVPDRVPTPPIQSAPAVPRHASLPPVVRVRERDDDAAAAAPQRVQAQLRCHHAARRRRLRRDGRRVEGEEGPRARRAVDPKLRVAPEILVRPFVVDVGVACRSQGHRRRRLRGTRHSAKCVRRQIGVGVTKKRETPFTLSSNSRDGSSVCARSMTRVRHR